MLFFSFIFPLQAREQGTGGTTVTNVGTPIKKGLHVLLSAIKPFFSPRLLLGCQSSLCYSMMFNTTFWNKRDCLHFPTYFWSQNIFIYINNNKDVQNYEENDNTANIYVLFMHWGPGKGFYSFISQMCDECWVCARQGLGLKVQQWIKWKRNCVFVAFIFQWSPLHEWPHLFEEIHSFRPYPKFRMQVWLFLRLYRRGNLDSKKWNTVPKIPKLEWDQAEIWIQE